MKYFIFVFCLILLLSSAKGDIEIAKTTHTYESAINTTIYANNITHQIISNIPYTILNNATTISALRITCSRQFTGVFGGTSPTSNFIFRFYRYHTEGNYELLDNAYITPSQCIDYGFVIQWNLYNIISIDHSYNYAIGYYSNNETIGTWYLPASTNYTLFGDQGHWLNVTNSSDYLANESITDPYTAPIIINGNETVGHIPLSVIGSIVPTPTPTSPPTTPTPGGTPSGGTVNQNFSNETYKNIGNMPLGNSSTGIASVLSGAGYGNSLNGLIQFIKDIIGLFTFFGFILFLIKFYNAK